MKRLSIKLRVTLWFTLIILMIVALVVAFLLTFGMQAVASGSRTTLVTVVDDSIGMIEYENGRLEIDDDIDYFRNGVYIAIYDNEEKLLYGRLPSGFDVSTAFYDGEIRTVRGDSDSWNVYDALYTVGGERVWGRGVSSHSNEDNALHIILRLIFFFMPVIVLLAAINGYLIINRAFRPVRRITEAAEQINEGKDLSARIALSGGHDEIYTLAATFDGMFDRLEAAFEAEKQFTSDASHELRTPTAVIISQCELAIEHAQTLEEARQALGTVLSHAQRMSALIAQLLSLSRADRGQTVLNPERFCLSEIAELVAEQTAELANKRDIVCMSDIEPDIYCVGDQTMLMRMLLNLTDNAVKYGRQGGQLRISLRRENGEIIGEVADNGIGINTDQLSRIWERFYQADEARSSSNSGVGLGLPIVKLIAEAHGGTVRAESSPGEGSRFIFNLPIAAD